LFDHARELVSADADDAVGVSPGVVAAGLKWSFMPKVSQRHQQQQLQQQQYRQQPQPQR
jgi:hypothetical protein